MRNLILALFVVVAASTWFFARMGGGGSSVEPEPDLLPDGRSSPASDTGDDGGQKQPDSLVLPARGKSPATASTTQPTVEGAILDRFGHPISNERVFLLRSDQSHPAHGTDLAFYVTGITKRDGTFSIQVPDEGPWRMTVGRRGKPRTSPSKPRTVDGPTRVDVTVDGEAGIRVLLDGVPKDGSHISVELMALIQPSNVAPPPAVDGGQAEPRKRSDRGGRQNRRNQRDASGNDSGADDGAFRTSTEDDVERRARLAHEVEYSTLARLAQEGQEGQEAQGAEDSTEGRGGERGGRNRQGRRGRQGKVDIPTPPPERWISLRRHLVTPEELAAGVAEFSGLPGGSIARLGLRVGKERIEGQFRFTLVANSITVVRILTVKTGPGAALTYTSSLETLPANERPVGIRWAE